MTKQTYTIAELELSPAAYDEIATKLRAAGYDHAFGPDGTLDMSGIGVVRGPGPDPNPLGYDTSRPLAEIAREMAEDRVELVTPLRASSRRCGGIPEGAGGGGPRRGPRLRRNAIPGLPAHTQRNHH